MRHLLTFFFINIALCLQAQDNELHLFLGASKYQGDLTATPFSLNGFGRAFGATYRYGFTDKIYIRAGLTSGYVSAADDTEGPTRFRNLSFESNIFDGYVAMEYRLLTPDRFPVTPYVFAGVGVFNFNPFVRYGDKNEKVFLQPLGTEGQGLPEFPDRKPYSLTQVHIPFGGGLLWNINDKWMLGAEARLNLTFTDYLDDVSTTYAPPGPLLRDRGPLAVELAWRRDEIDGTPYPISGGGTRGSPDANDLYYYVGLTIGMKINNNKNYFKMKRNQLGCPQW